MIAPERVEEAEFMSESPILNPLAAAEAIRESYERYLISRHAPRDARLRNDFRAALAGDFALTRGPLLQASPPFEQGVSLTDLVHEEILHEGFLELDPNAFPTERPLYRHQEEAIRRAVSHRNLIVATGTGSGKTECYLFPILDHLLRERTAETLASPGVRAMLLYPMNALANDQLKRLRDVLAG
ncbi:MAG: DEAD/DEAH box helicase, partial [Acidimicrobiia bacterium]|nr:DEAD/DEAH box helicase [Acidimicrobiia bacterium]